MPDLFSTSISPSAKKLLQEKVFGVLPPSVDSSSPLGNVYDYDPQEKLELPQDTNLKWFMDKQAERERLSKSSYGMGISPELETIVSIFRDPAGTALDLGIQKLDSSTRLPGQEDSNLSMIPTKTNILRFLSKMSKAAQNIPTQTVRENPDYLVGRSYFDARYPKHTEFAELHGGEVNLEPPDRSNPLRRGSFYPDDSTVSVFMDPFSLQSNSPAALKASASQKAGTVGHEFTHSLQKNHPWSKHPEEAFYTPEQMPGGTYVTGNAARAAGDPNLYFGQPVEREAAQAAETVREGFDKFLELYPKVVNPRRVPFRGKQLDDIRTGVSSPEEEKQIVSSAFKRAIKEVLKLEDSDITKIYASRLKDTKKQVLDELSAAENPLYREKQKRLAELKPGEKLPAYMNRSDYDYRTKYAYHPAAVAEVISPYGIKVDPNASLDDVIKQSNSFDWLQQRLNNRLGLAETRQADLKIQEITKNLLKEVGQDPLTQFLQKTLRSEALIRERKAALEKGRKASLKKFLQK